MATTRTQSTGAHWLQLTRRLSPVNATTDMCVLRTRRGQSQITLWIQRARGLVLSKLQAKHKEGIRVLGILTARHCHARAQIAHRPGPQFQASKSRTTLARPSRRPDLSPDLSLARTSLRAPVLRARHLEATCEKRARAGPLYCCLSTMRLTWSDVKLVRALIELNVAPEPGCTVDRARKYPQLGADTNGAARPCSSSSLLTW
jgi:hypothetical protein